MIDSYIASNRARAEQAAKEAQISAENAAGDFFYTNAADYINETSNGGEAIQAAVNALPAKGGVVFIPSDGPDDNVTHSGKNISEDGVWKVESPIEIYKPGVTLLGEAIGSMGTTQDSSSGTVLLTPDSSQYIDYMIYFDFCAGCSIRHLRADGGRGSTSSGNARHVVEINDNDPGNTVCTFRLDHAYLHHADETALRVNGQNNNLASVHIDNSQLNDTAGSDSAAIRIDGAPDYFSATVSQTIFSLVGHILDVNQKVNNLYFDQCGTAGGQGTAYDAFRINDDVDSLFISQSDQYKYQNSLLKVESGASLFGGEITGLNIEGDNTQPHIIDNQGTIEELSIGYIDYQGLTGSPYVNFVNDVANTTRVTINGMGYNGSNDPSSAGDWNGNGEEGIKVLWDNGGTPTISEYVNGTWYSKAL